MNVLSHVHPTAASARARFHADTVSEVRSAVEANSVVVVGMGWNPAVGRARKLLDERKVPHVYLGYGNYVSGWQKRLAIKLWSGWPTFPQVFVNGALIGGCSDMKALIESGEFDRILVER